MLVSLRYALLKCYLDMHDHPIVHVLEREIPSIALYLTL